MCSYLHEIEDSVSEFVNANTMFTAWDVTMAVRKRSQDRVQHYEVKREVHKMFDQGSMFSYNRTLANLPNVSPQPWIYHPLGSDVSQYNGHPTVSGSSAPAAPSPVQSISSVDDGNDDGSDTAADGSIVYKFDSTDRLCVPNKFVRQIGLKKGDVVAMLCSNHPSNEVEVFKFDLNKHGTCNTYTVDSYDNVRISRAALQQLGINGVAFEMEAATDKVVVKKYA